MIWTSIRLCQTSLVSHWRYKDVEVDAVFHLSHGVRVGLEYDGAFHHSARQRDRRQYENDKSRVLVEAGLLHLLIHVRIGDLPEMVAPHALVVAVPEGATAYQQASAVASALATRFPEAVPGLNTYLNGGMPRHRAAADAYITAVWGELRPPRRKPKKVGSPAPRRLSPRAPHADSLLSPVSEPYRNPEDPDEVVRDYRCDCGDPGIFTAAQSQVTSRNTRSCGCLATQARQRPRPAVSKTETHAVRAWAQQRAMAIGGSGRARPGRGCSTRRVFASGAVSAGRQLGARGRVTGELWLDYSTKELAAGPHIKETRRAGRTAAWSSPGGFPRNVGAPQGRVVANGHPGLVENLAENPDCGSSTRSASPLVRRGATPSALSPEQTTRRTDD